ncbi:hypothetical protein VZT92_012003 [Zoarces viviparus]|uniref:Uncharacterized protein n=1 Tax=Zoarces viviparus TaxID=48416 RepID=A0AAW1F730_ZOAVI
MKELWDDMGLWSGSVGGEGGRGGGAYISLSRLACCGWASTHISCPLFSGCQSPCSPKLACLPMDYLGERVYPFIPLSL